MRNAWASRMVQDRTGRACPQVQMALSEFVQLARVAFLSRFNLESSNGSKIKARIPMTFSIGPECIDRTDKSCLDVCPVDCIYIG